MIRFTWDELARLAAPVLLEAATTRRMAVRAAVLGDEADGTAGVVRVRCEDGVVFVEVG